MEKKNNTLIIVLVLLIVAGFITELFYFGGSFTLNLPFLGNQGAETPENATGTAIFNGTIRTYDPVLGITANSSREALDAIRGMPGVKDVRVQADITLIETETRDDVYPTALALKAMNISCIAVANIAMPPEIVVNTPSGPVNATVTNPIIQVETEPLVDVDMEVPVAMTAVVGESGLLIGWYEPRLLAARSSFMADAEVSALANMTFTYEIPWSARNSVDFSSLGAAGYVYRQADTVLFSPPLNVSMIIARRALPYITYIDAGSAEVSPAFGDEAGLRADFPETNVSFRPSVLAVTAPAMPDLRGTGGAALNYTPSASYSYVLALPQSVGGYDIGNMTFVTVVTAPLEVGSTVPLNVTILSIGDKVLSVTPAG
jgi:hypothetical protein